MVAEHFTFFNWYLFYYLFKSYFILSYSSIIISHISLSCLFYNCLFCFHFLFNSTFSIKKKIHKKKIIIINNNKIKTYNHPLPSYSITNSPIQIYSHSFSDTINLHRTWIRKCYEIIQLQNMQLYLYVDYL